jgi:16S rRNA (guanine966-N2)-methyltransferase
MGPAGAVAPFALAFLDPPYGKGLGERALTSLGGGGWLLPGAVAVIEERVNAEVALPREFTEIDRRTYGDTQVVLARFEG